MGLMIERLVDRLERAGYQQGAQVLQDTGVSLEQAGLIPHELPNGTSPETKSELEIEWERQAQKYIELDFPNVLGMSEIDFKNSLPKFEPQPESYKKRFDIPLIVVTKINPKRQLELAGFDYITSEKYSIRDDERGGNPFDGAALAITHPEVLKKHSVYLPESTVDPGGALCLRGWYGRRGLRCSWVGDADPSYGSLSCGR